MDGKYPGVYWPDHPAARAHGMVHVHRIVAWEKFDGIPDGMHVHHVDGDPWNWAPGNLELVDPRAHGEMHADGESEIRPCGVCGDPVKVHGDERKHRRKVYCSTAHAGIGSRKIEWPSVDSLQEMVDDLGYTGTGEMLGVSDVAVRKHLRKFKPR